MEQEVDHSHVALSRDRKMCVHHCPVLPWPVFIPAGLRCPVWLAVHLLLDSVSLGLALSL